MKATKYHLKIMYKLVIVNNLINHFLFLIHFFYSLFINEHNKKNTVQVHSRWCKYIIKNNNLVRPAGTNNKNHLFSSRIISI